MSEENSVEKVEEVLEKKICKIFLNVPYNKKDMAKELWFRFDGVRKCWYIQVRGVFDIEVLTTVIFLFDYVDIEGENMSIEEVEEIKRKFIEKSEEMNNKEKGVVIKKRLYEGKKRKVCCENCFKVGFIDIENGICRECINV